MSEHIKSGAEIWKALDENIKDRGRNIRERIFDKRIFAKWISIPWLKAELKKMRSEVKHSHVPSYESLTKVLSLLEEKP